MSISRRPIANNCLLIHIDSIDYIQSVQDDYVRRNQTKCYVLAMHTCDSK